jgi:hypothetical protein
MDIPGGGIDMGVAEQSLHHREIDPGLGQSGPERVPQRVRMSLPTKRRLSCLL